mgnify:CR=1 FL=1
MRKIFMGVSVASRQFSRRYIARVVRDGAALADEVLFLVADIPQAHTFVAKGALSYVEGFEKARNIGDEKIASINRAVRSVSGVDISTKVWRWDNVEEYLEYLELREKILGEIRYNKKMHGDVRDEVRAYARREGLHSREFNEEIAGVYVCEELAVVIFLHKYLGYEVQIAPKTPPGPMENWYKGVYDWLPSPEGCYHMIM